MKEFRGNHSIYGRWFDYRFCARSIKDAATTMNTSEYYIKTYWTATKIDLPYNDIFVTPYSFNAKKLLGYKEIEIETAKKVINKEREELKDTWKRLIG